LIQAADLGFYKGAVSNPSERGTGGQAPKAPGWDIGKCISYIKMVSFYAFPAIFINIVTALTTCFEHIFFKKGHPNQKGWCPDTLDTPGSATAQAFIS